MGGTIDLKSDINISGEAMSYLTIAGQTAPGGGIQTRYATINVRDGAHDIIVRHLRYRRRWTPDVNPGSNNNGPGLMLYSYYPNAPVYNVILVHNSFAWAQDDTGSWNHVHDVTWQWNIFSEAKNTHVGSTDLKGTNGKGSIHGTEPDNGRALFNLSFHHNFLPHNFQRTPLISGHGPVEIVNNLVYNYAAFGTQIQNRGGGSYVNIIGNYYKPGPDTYRSRYAVLLNAAAPRVLAPVPDTIYVRDNLSLQRSEGRQPDWLVVGLCGDVGVYCTVAAPKDLQRSSPWPASEYPISISPAQNLPSLILDGAGTTLPRRDANDARLANEYRATTGSIHTFNAWPYLASGSAPADSDHDGMPDAWEQAKGLNPTDPQARNRTSLSAQGYTNLEVYLNGL